ncbi:MAG: universal stress protein [Thermodesulfobacteriota bacterium]
MKPRLFHIFRNTPFGRETILQSLYFCKLMDCRPVVYFPESDKFLMYFENEAIQIDLDRSYLKSPETAEKNVSDLMEKFPSKPVFLRSENRTATNLPDVQSDFEYMTCPRTISDLSSKIGLGYIGARVRKIVKSAQFPVLIPSTVFKPWESVTVFFGGSVNSVNAMRLAITVSKTSGKPLKIITFKEKKKSSKDYENILKQARLYDLLEKNLSSWDFYEISNLEKDLYQVPHDSILVMGAYGHGVIKDVLFGSVLEKIQTIMPNSMLIAGPKYSMP